MTTATARQMQSIQIVALVGVSLLAVWLRTHNLTVWPLWLDEAFSLFGADQGFHFIWKVLPTYETHPPFYTALLRCWILVAGDSTLALRTFGVILGLLTLPAIWLAAREIAIILRQNRAWLPLAAIALAATAPSLIDIARLVRPYYYMILIYAVGTAALLRLYRLHLEQGSLDPLAWRTYLIAAILLFWSHSMGALYVAALGLSLLTLIGPHTLIRNHLTPFLIGHAIVALLALPAFMILLDQAPTWVSSTWLHFNPSAVPAQVLLLFGLPGTFGIIAALILAALGVGRLGKTHWRITVALLILGFVPIFLEIGISLIAAPVFLVRTLVACSVPVLILMAVGGSGTSRPGWFCLVLLMIFNVDRAARVQQLPPVQDWYGAVNWLKPHFRTGDRIYAYPNQGGLPLRYALRDMKVEMPFRPIPGEVPSHDPKGWYPTGTRGIQSLSDERLAEIADDPLSRSTPTIWLLRLSKKYYDKTDNSVRIFGKGRYAVAHFKADEIDIIGFAKSPQPAPPQQAKP